jgi:hypothetical protein
MQFTVINNVYLKIVALREHFGYKYGLFSSVHPATHLAFNNGSEIMKQPSLAKLNTYDPNPLLDTVTEHLNVKNDAALSRALAIAPPIISKIRHRKMVVGPALLIRMHEITHISIKELRALMGDRRPIFC